MSVVLALSGKIKSGKSTVASKFAESVGWPHVSFGDYLRVIANQRGLEPKREILQDIGDGFIRKDLEGFCRAVLAQAEWHPGQSLVIDGVRHAEVNNLLRSLVSPSRYVLTYLSVDDQVRQARLRLEGIDAQDSVQKVEDHPTEEQVKNVLPHIADYILNGTEPVSVLIEKLKGISSDEPYGIDIPVNQTNILEVIETVRNMTIAEQREVLARIWSEQAAHSGDKVWMSVRFNESSRVVAYAPQQERYVRQLRDLLLRGAIARIENESDGTYELYGSDRTYFVTMTPSRQFAALLSSWTPEDPVREVSLQGIAK